MAVLQAVINVGSLVGPFLVRAWEFLQKAAAAKSEEELAVLRAERDAALEAHDERWAQADAAIAARDAKMKAEIDAARQGGG